MLGKVGQFGLLLVLSTGALVASFSAAAADTLDDIKARGAMIVGIDPTFAPYEFTDSSGAITGYDPSLLRAVADGLGVTIEYRTMAWSALLELAARGLERRATRFRRPSAPAIQGVKA